VTAIEKSQVGQKTFILQKRSGEVVENKCLWKKRTGEKQKAKLYILLKTKSH